MRIIIIIGLVLISLPAFSQRQIKGVIKDAKYNEMLIGSSIEIKGNNKGLYTYSDLDGSFSLEVEDNEFNSNPVVKVSYTGYNDLEFNLLEVVDYQDIKVCMYSKRKSSKFCDYTNEKPKDLSTVIMPDNLPTRGACIATYQIDGKWLAICPKGVSRREPTESDAITKNLCQESGKLIQIGTYIGFQDTKYYLYYLGRQLEDNELNVVDILLQRGVNF